MKEPISNVLPFDGSAAVELADPSAAGAPGVDQAQESLKTESNTLLDAAKSLVVKTADDYRKAGAFRAKVAAAKKNVDIERRKRVDPLNLTVKVINADYKGISDQFDQVLAVIDAPMIAYKEEEDRKNLEAKAAADKERKRLEDEAKQKADDELKRLEGIRKEQGEAAAKVQTAANPFEAFLAQAELDKKAKEAEAAVESTKQAIRDTRVATPASTVSKVTAAGTSFRKNWKHEVIDVDLLPRELMIPNDKLLGEIAREEKGKASRPGVRFYAESSIGGR